ncbi:hypothetical protein CapIbe_023723 [Capra ibex]
MPPPEPEHRSPCSLLAPTLCFRRTTLSLREGSPSAQLSRCDASGNRSRTTLAISRPQPIPGHPKPCNLTSPNSLLIPHLETPRFRFP